MLLTSAPCCVMMIELSENSEFSPDRKVEIIKATALIDVSRIMKHQEKNLH